MLSLSNFTTKIMSRQQLENIFTTPSTSIPTPVPISRPRPRPTISNKNCETRTPSHLIQCWLQVCQLISGLGRLAWLVQAWHNIESGGRGDSG